MQARLKKLGAFPTARAAVGGLLRTPFGLGRLEAHREEVTARSAARAATASHRAQLPSRCS
jgi:hypothetical protein